MSNNNIENIELKDLLRAEGVNSKGFGIIPKAVMQDQRLTRDAKSIYAYFCSYAGSGDTAFPGVERICSDLAFKAEETYRKHLNILKKYNYIRVEQIRTKGKFARNVYVLVSKPNPENDVVAPEEQEEQSPSPKFSRTVKSAGIGGLQPSLKKSRTVKSRTNISGTNNNSFNNNNIKTTTDKKVVVEESFSVNEEKVEGKKEFHEEQDISTAEIKVTDEIQEVKKEIQDIIGAEIHHKIVKELIDKKGKEKIKYYLSNWLSLTQAQTINNVAGFFNKAVTDEYPIPIAQNKGPIAYDGRASQCGNFDQRQYEDEFYDGLYDNVKKLKCQT